MTTKPTLDDAGSKYGASMGRGWDFAGQPAMAQVVVDMYDATPPKTDTERRHHQVAHAALHRARQGYDEPRKVALQRIRLDRGGYDAGGAYWGIGQPLYWAGSDDGLVDLWFRAATRADAKRHVLSQFRGATFYR